ncbi:MAG: LysM peptidoglycan-binding domain-containing protein [Chloroflexota bacterium]|nr:LysM peptidoglycan-binding domain-containing protein [Chloroflexota bacterium]
MSLPGSRGPSPAALPWLLAALALFAIAVVAGLGAAYLVTLDRAVPTVDAALLATPTARPTEATPARTATVPPTATARPTAAVSPTGTATATSSSPTPSPRTHVVARGETLSIIAARYSVTWQEIARLNGIENANHIQVGQVLLIPPAPPD